MDKKQQLRAEPKVAGKINEGSGTNPSTSQWKIAVRYQQKCYARESKMEDCDAKTMLSNKRKPNLWCSDGRTKTIKKIILAQPEHRIERRCDKPTHTSVNKNDRASKSMYIISVQIYQPRTRDESKSSHKKPKRKKILSKKSKSRRSILRLMT